MTRLSVRTLKGLIRTAIKTANQDPGPATGELRKVLDVMIREAFRQKIKEPGTEPLHNLIGPLGKGYMPERIKNSANFVKDVGNTSVHSIETKITGTKFVTTLQDLLHVLRWFEAEFPKVVDTGAPDSTDGAQRERDSSGPFAGKTVYLAAIGSESDIEDEWHEVHSLLLNDGVKVITAPATADAPSPDLFVQIFSTLDALHGASSQVDAIQKTHPSVPVLQWRSRLPNPKIDSEIVESLEPEDKTLCTAASVRTGLFEEFKVAIRETLEHLMKPIQEGPSPDRPYLYITADVSNSNDLQYARELVNAARNRADVDLMKEKNRRKDFDAGLKYASGVVFLHGETGRQFIDEWLAYYMRKRRDKGVKVRLTALYRAPPKKKQDQEPLVGFDGLRPYGSEEEFTVDGIEQICAELSSDRSS